MVSKLLPPYALLITVTTLLLQQAQPQQDEKVYGGREYYIITFPTEQFICPPEFEACLTLDQFTTNNSQHIDFLENATLTFQRTQHVLVSQLTVVNISQFSMRTEESNSSSAASIVCCNENFVFENVSEVNISGLLFVNCTQTMESVEQIIVENCTFDSQDHHGTVFHTLSSKEILIHGCVFHNNTASHFIISSDSKIMLFETEFASNTIYYGGISAIGGNNITINNCTIKDNRFVYYALIVIDGAQLTMKHTDIINNVGNIDIHGRDSNIMLFETVFASNTIYYGGIRAIGGSITINNCTMKDNRVAYDALIDIDGAQLTMEHTDIINNVGNIINIHDFSQLTMEHTNITNNVGNIIDISHFSQVSIFGCVFERNRPSGNSVVLMSLSNGNISASNFTENKNASDGVISSYEANVHIDSCTFDGNLVEESFGFGAIHIYEGTVNIDNCTFNGNIAEKGIGAIRIYEGTANIDNCTFDGNIANSEGGIGAIHIYEGTVNIDNSVFDGNIAERGRTIDISEGTVNIVKL